MQKRLKDLPNNKTTIKAYGIRHLKANIQLYLKRLVFKLKKIY